MSERRITADEVVQAYKAMGLRPKRSRIWDSDGGCCPLGVLAGATGIRATNANEAGDRFRWATETFGDDYARAFIYGFEECRMYYKDAERCPEGRKDGDDVLNACIREFGNF